MKHKSWLFLSDENMQQVREKTNKYRTDEIFNYFTDYKTFSTHTGNVINILFIKQQ